MAKITIAMNKKQIGSHLFRLIKDDIQKKGITLNSLDSYVLSKSAIYTLGNGTASSKTIEKACEYLGLEVKYSIVTKR